MKETTPNHHGAPADLIPQIRPTARAVILQQQQILVLRKEGYVQGTRYALPGGAQEPGESLHEALQRECEEEIGTQVSIGAMLHVAEHFKLRDSQPPTRRHLLEMLFRCEVPADYQPRNGHHPDRHQVAVQWMPLDRLLALPLYPPYLGECITRLSEPQRPFYLGEV